MPAIIEPNELVAAKRCCTVIVAGSIDGTPAPPNTDFTNCVFISQSSSDYVRGVGTLTAKKKTIGGGTTIDITATDTVANTVTAAAHGYRTGAGPWDPSATLGGLSVAVPVYLIAVDDNTLAFATSEANAFAGTKIDLTADVSSVNIVSNGATKEAIPGHFLYTFTQAETSFVGSDADVFVDKAAAGQRWYGYASVTVKPSAKGFDDIAEGSATYGDYLRAKGREALYKFDRDVDGNYQFYKPDETTPSHGGQMLDSGRDNTHVDDLTP